MSETPVATRPNDLQETGNTHYENTKEEKAADAAIHQHPESEHRGRVFRCNREAGQLLGGDGRQARSGALHSHGNAVDRDAEQSDTQVNCGASKGSTPATLPVPDAPQAATLSHSAPKGEIPSGGDVGMVIAEKVLEAIDKIVELHYPERRTEIKSEVAKIANEVINSSPCSDTVTDRLEQAWMMMQDRVGCRNCGNEEYCGECDERQHEVSEAITELKIRFINSSLPTRPPKKNL